MNKKYSEVVIFDETASLTQRRISALFADLLNDRRMAAAGWIVTMREGLRLVDSRFKQVCAHISEFAHLPLNMPQPKTEFPLPEEL